VVTAWSGRAVRALPSLRISRMKVRIPKKDAELCRTDWEMIDGLVGFIRAEMLSSCKDEFDSNEARPCEAKETESK